MFPKFALPRVRAHIRVCGKAATAASFRLEAKISLPRLSHNAAAVGQDFVRTRSDRLALALFAVGTPRPTAGSAFSLGQVFAPPVDALAPGPSFLRGFDPADPFVAGERRDV